MKGMDRTVVWWSKVQYRTVHSLAATPWMMARLPGILLAFWIVMTPPVVAGAEERLPLTLTSNGNTYTIDTFTPGTNKDGKTTVTITGSGYLVPFRDGRMIVPVWCSFTSGTEEYEWDGVTLNNDSFIFSFSTSKKPETVKFYAEDRQDKKYSFKVK